jgi:hypothetical protein
MLALRGYVLVIGDACGKARFLIERWGLVRECDTLAEVEGFARQVGVQP